MDRQSKKRRAPGNPTSVKTLGPRGLPIPSAWRFFLFNFHGLGVHGLGIVIIDRWVLILQGTGRIFERIHEANLNFSARTPTPTALKKISRVWTTPCEASRYRIKVSSSTFMGVGLQTASLDHVVPNARSLVPAMVDNLYRSRQRDVQRP